VLIAVENVSIEFDGVRVLSSFSATFQSGKVTALVGPSGSGKTSLLGVMAGLAKPTHGRVTLHEAGLPPCEPDPVNVVWVPQGSNALATRSALENVMVAALADGASFERATAQADRALNAVGLRNRRTALARQLSGGELQRLSIARALASSRPLLFADEPTANLDEGNSIKIASILRDLPSTSRTIVVSTHDPLLMSAADHVVQLRGRGSDAD